MALKLTAPIEKEFTLDHTDRLFETEGTTVRVRQASQRENEERAALFQEMIRRYDANDNVSVIQHFNFPRLMRKQAQLTVVESNITDETGRALFRPGMPGAEFELAWGKLPPAVAWEIHEKVLELNPDWAPAGE